MSNRYRYHGKTFSQEELIQILTNIMLSSLVLSKHDTIKQIKKIVPKRTGQIHDSLIDWINTQWRVRKDNMTISLGTFVPYADRITGDVAHRSTWFEHSGKPATASYYGHSGNIFLNDPQAIIDWKIKIGEYIKEVFEKYIEIYKGIYLG